MGRRVALVSKIGTICLALLAVASQAQTDSTKPSFDVVSIHPHNSAQNGSSVHNSPDGVRFSDVFIVTLIHDAYDVHMENQVEGLPGWAKTESYDIEAKADEKTAESWKGLSYKEKYEAQRPLILSLLEDRCQLKAHAVSREMPVYDLVIAKSGLKMKESAPDGPKRLSIRRGKLEAYGATTGSIAGALQARLGRIFVDKTDLGDKRFDFMMEWAEDNGALTTEDSGPSIFTAFEEQLGLKLVPDKGPVTVVVVDHIEKPSPN